MTGAAAYLDTALAALRKARGEVAGGAAGRDFTIAEAGAFDRMGHAITFLIEAEKDVREMEREA